MSSENNSLAVTNVLGFVWGFFFLVLVEVILAREREKSNGKNKARSIFLKKRVKSFSK